MINPMDLTGRLILVTGASSGIGRATSILLSKLGARLLLVARNRERLRETVGQLEGNDHRLEIFDLNAVDSLAGWLKSLSLQTGPLKGVVHCAGVRATRPVGLVSGAEAEDMFRINVIAGLMLAKAFRHKDVHEAGGSLVFVSSVMGIVGAAGLSTYCASKGALLAMTMSLSLELARDRLRVNCVAPAFVRTQMLDDTAVALPPEQLSRIRDMHPLGFGEPLDVAHAIAFLLADTSRWITGSTLVVDGGYTAH